VGSDEHPVIHIPKRVEDLKFTGERFVPGTEGEIEHEHLHRYLFAMQLCADRDVLDVASGEGYGSAMLASVARSVVGIELAPEVVEHATRTYQAPTLAFHQGDALALPLPDGSVDVVVSFETVEHLTDQKRFLSEVRRVLRPRGLLILSSPVRGIYAPDPPNPFHRKELTREEMQALVGEQFEHLGTLSQMSLVGSALRLDASKGKKLEEQLYWREENGDFRVENPAARSPYLVVVASDGPLPPLRSGLLQDPPYLGRILGSLRQAIDHAATADELRGALEVTRAELATARSGQARSERTAESEREERHRLEKRMEAAQRDLAAVRARQAQLELALESEKVERRRATEELATAIGERDERTAAMTRATEAMDRMDVEVEQLREDLDQATRWTWQNLPSKVVRGLKRGARLRPSTVLRRGVPEGLRQRWAMKRLAGSGFFDAAYYRGKYPDMARSEMEPLRHYVLHGAGEGRNPHPMFDTRYYVEQNRELIREGVNPLLHFLEKGRAEGRRPHPAYAAEEFLPSGAPSTTPSVAENRLLGEDATESRPTAEVRVVPPSPPARFRPQPLGSSASTAPEADLSAPRTLILSHVLPFPPRAGNEYRIDRMVRFLARAGHEVHLLVVPLPGETPSPSDLSRAAAQYPNLVVLLRDGTLLHQSRRRTVSALLESLGGERPRTFPSLSVPSAGRTGRMLGLEATFCPDFLIDVVLRLEGVIQPRMILANYIFMGRVLPMLERSLLKVIDTIDVFSTKQSKVVQYGVPDALAISQQEEAAMLGKADLIIAIQPEEEGELRALVPHRTVVTAGVDFDVPGSVDDRATEPIVLLVGSGNALNVKGARDLLALGWPLIRRQVPGARLWIAGQLGEALEAGVEGVELLGKVDDLDRVYGRARVVVNPAVAGTGLKIKTLEALSRGKPIVVWPNGVDGLPPALRQFCDVVTNWYDFSRRVTDRLDPATGGWSTEERAEILHQLSPEVVYGPLAAALRARLEGVSGAEAHHG